MAGMRKRRGKRIPIRHPAFFETVEQKGAATLIEMSYSGARVEASDVRLTRGEPVRLYVWAQHQAEPFELAGTVASVRGDGFAIEYARVGQEICQWIDALQLGSSAEPTPAQGEGAS